MNQKIYTTQILCCRREYRLSAARLPVDFYIECCASNVMKTVDQFLHRMLRAEYYENACYPFFCNVQLTSSCAFLLERIFPTPTMFQKEGLAIDQFTS